MVCAFYCANGNQTPPLTQLGLPPPAAIPNLADVPGMMGNISLPGMPPVSLPPLTAMNGLPSLPTLPPGTAGKLFTTVIYTFI